MLEKTFDPERIESRHYERWEKGGYFSCTPQGRSAPFCLMMPPPNVTGSLHMGHALNMTLQDVLTRYWRMKGRDTLWQPGTDHAGIATQMVVERNLEKEGIKRRDLGREGFLEKVWEWKAWSGGTITNQVRRLGATPDWRRERFTMDEGLSRAVRRVFIQLYREGLIYRDKRLVNWDPKLRTAISDLEVEQKEIKGHMWHIAYPLQGEEARTITVATTRPETMLGDTAIAVHPDDPRYTDLIGKFAILPIVGRPIPIIADSYADPEQGSGAVKITPAHDFNDFEVGRRNALPMISILDENACINANAPEEYQGLDRFEARRKILQELESLDALVAVVDHVHVIPHGDRSGAVIEPFLTDQWYVDTPTLAKPAIAAVRDGRTVFHPKQYENMYFDWLENQLPWCISRQLWWGHQIPIWYDPDGKVYVAETEAEAQAQAGAGIRLTQDEDVLDTWFSSALWPFSTLGWPDETPELAKYYPGDVLVTGFDIITFWVSRMMMMGLHFMGDVPFRDVYIHALVRDSKGQKMSKSKGNVMDPLEMIDRYGADALRFTLCAMAAQGRDIRLAEGRVEGYRNFATKLWNAARYCQMNDCVRAPDFDPENASSVPNRWIAGCVVRMKADLEKAIESYRFNEAAAVLYQFVWGTFCDWYLEITKPILSDRPASDPVAIETRAMTAWVMDQILVLLNPFMPFITEELFDSTRTDPHAPLMAGAWPDYPDSLQDPAAHADIEWLIRFVTAIRSVRSDMNVPAAAKIALFVREATPGTAARMHTFEEIIVRMARLESLALSANSPKGAIQTVVDEAVLCLPVAGVIDIARERTRLRKEIDRLAKDVQSLTQKLENTKFLDSAPADIIAEQKSRQKDAQTTLGKLTHALEQIDAA